jgi:hypothetical protein
MVKVVKKINGDKYFDTEGVHGKLDADRKRMWLRIHRTGVEIHCFTGPLSLDPPHRAQQTQPS